MIRIRLLVKQTFQFMKIPLYLILLLILSLSGCDKKNSDPPYTPPVTSFYKGADISFLPEIEEAGVKFYDKSGKVAPLTEILKSSGVNTIRLRLWHTPSTKHSGLAEVSAFARQLKVAGFKIFLTIHYSDTWADPGNQAKPAAWNGLSLSVLGDSVYNYTKHTVQEIDPDIIEVGNEISNGFLWPEGKISNQSGFITLLKRGVQGARDATPDKRKILMHCATLDVSGWFYTILKTNQIDYDVIGLSYYPFWTKIPPSQAIALMDSLSSTFNKDVLIAETAYPYTLEWNDYTNNIIGLQNQLLQGYPATEAGQKLILTEIRQGMENFDKGIGFCYWAPEWVAFKGPQSTTGSSWENMALFDFNNKALPGLDVFN